MPLLTAGTNCLTEKEDTFQRMLSESLAFQVWVNAADATEALAAIYINALPRELDHYTKTELESIGHHALVYSEPDERGFVQLASARGSVDEYLAAGVIVVAFTGIYPTEGYNFELADVTRTFDNSVGDVIEELNAMSSAGDNLTITEFARDGATSFEPEDRFPGVGVMAHSLWSMPWTTGDTNL